MRITVCGDGHIALSIAAVCGSRGHAVRVLASARRRWRNVIDGRLPDTTRFVGPIDLVTSDPREALARADVVFIAVPHAAIVRTLQRLAPHLRRNMLVGAVPGFGGFGPVARRLLGLGTLFGTQRIPFVVRAYTPGERVVIGGIRRQTFVATMPANQAFAVSEVLRDVLGVPTVPMSHFFNVELSPSNSIVNPARVYALFGPGVRRSPRAGDEFFTDWDVRSSRTLLRLDEELQAGRRFIPRDTSFVAPIRLQYDADSAATLTKRFRCLHALEGRPVPLRRSRGGIVLDSSSEYVSEDLDHGLVLVRDILQLAGAPTAFMNAIIKWRHALPGSRDRGPEARVQRKIAAFENIEDLARALD